MIAGAHRGARLETPPGKILRPMRARVRESLFNILGPDGVAGATLDLFAGSGSLGIEALSRGAERAVFVDWAPPCLAVLQQNLRRLKLDDRAVVLRHDLGRGVQPLRAHGPFDLVLVHPPFELLRRAVGPGEPDVTELLTSLVTTPELLAGDALVCFETPRGCYREPESELPALEVITRREYGSTALFVARAAAS